MGLSSPSQLISAIIAINVVMFAVSILIDFRPSSLQFSPFHFLSPSNRSLFLLGSTGTIPVFEAGRWWTLVSANYLHGGLLHLLFNMLAFRQLAPLVMQEFGIYRAVSIYTLGGVAGFIISAFAGVLFTIGASAAVCALIGALLYYGKSRGGVYGQALFSQVGGWVVGIAIFGLLVPGINNWGHGGGLVAGLLLGYLLGYREKAGEKLSHKYLAMACIVVTVLVLLGSLINAARIVIF